MSYRFERHKVTKPKFSQNGKLNMALAKLQAYGHYSYSEALNERGFRAKCLKKVKK